MNTEWVTSLSRTGDQMMRQGDVELETGLFAIARESYLMATDCYWMALCRTSRRTPEHRVLADAHLSAFRAAIPLLPHPATAFDLMGEGDQVAGYLFLPAGDPGSCRVVIWPVGPDLTPEAAYRQVALPILQSGLACVVFESLSADSGVEAVAEWALQQPGIDPDADPLSGVTFDSADPPP